MTVEQLSGGEMLIRALHDEGVEIVFGYPGGAVLHIYDAIFQQDKVEHILVRHEQAATHAADGYARATGRPGVVLVTSGPGATNAVTGIATAYMDSIPMVVLTGQVATPLIGNDAFQEVDTIGITRPCVKHNFLVRDVAQLGVVQSDLDAHGAVSEPVVLAMARGARERLGTTWAVSTSGIAGPTGGTPEKPVGTVWMAVSGPDGERAWCHRFGSQRERIIQRAARRILTHLHHAIQEGGVKGLEE